MNPTWLTDGGPPGPYCSRRLFEWVTTLALLGYGIELFFYPSLIYSSMFTAILQVINGEHLAVGFLLIGFIRLSALLANGSWPIAGPALRFVGALMGAVIWLEMGIALVHQYNAGSVKPVSIPMFIPLALGEMVSCYRAASDARTRYRKT